MWENFMKTFGLVATSVAALLASTSANAAVTIALGSNGGAFVSLTNAGLAGGSIATLSGGTIYNSDQPFADIPAGGVFGSTFLAAGPTSGAPATLTFAPGVTSISFLWGSPDTYNLFTVEDTLSNVSIVTASDLGFAVTNGNQSFSQYVTVTATGGATLKSFTFNNSPSSDAFEVANFSLGAVPEPATWAMMIGGFALAGISLRRRQTAVSFV
jgi:hypothetical protein